VTGTESRDQQQADRPEARPYPFGPPERLALNPMYARLREQEPLSRVRLPYGEDAWLVVRHEDVRTVFGDARFSRAIAETRDEPRVGPDRAGRNLLTMDPPEHSRLRRLVSKAFTARRVEQLRPRARQIADDLLDSMTAAGPPADLIESFAVPLPVTVICELLGVPVADRVKFRSWAEAILTTTALSREQRADYITRLGGYVAEQIAQRRRTPTDDLLGALVLARDEHDKLSELELVELSVGLLAGGYETTANQLGNSVYVLLTHPDELALLRERPELMPDAVEELMRFIPLTAAASLARYATVDVPLSGGVVPAGDPVVVSRSAANRDPVAFLDPDRLDLTRSPNPHVGFGYGAHFCLGAPLARMELQVALDALLTRFPGLRFATDPAELPWKTGMALRGLRSLPVTWCDG
jgi:cytochrome P450